MKEAKRLLVAGGGTGGHILAGIAIADEWKKQVGDGAEVLFVGAEQGLEARLVPKYGYRLKVLKIGALNRVTLKRKVLTLFQLPFSFLKTLFILLSYRPDAVIGVGGYSSGPVVLLARSIGGLWGVRTAIIEQNSVAGFTNRMLGKRVHRVFCAFQAATQLFNPKKVLVTGNPIRSSLKRLPSSVGIPFTLFIFGGSQGAAGINTLILDALPFLKGMEIDFIHQTGVYDYERVVKGYEREGIFGARVEKFIDDMASCYEKASLVVCRAGASSMSELASVGRAAIFIPLPTAADNHQEKNARIFEHADAAVVVPQGSMTGAEFAQKIIYLKTNSDVIHAIEAKVAKFYHSDAAFQIVKDLRT
jgi:UDP-N-acetylglucosamine--N-acetylmuramyl-(pentapeptide) pyrophosphoryl-undecaprenol N-acetylglucosamine transferase